MSNYDSFASHYDAVFGERREVARFLEQLIRASAPKAKTVLELGCGSGSMLKVLARRYEVTGVDSSAGMVRIAQKKVPQARTLVADITAFSLSQKFDVIVCPFDTINHVTSYAAWKRVFRQAARHLQPGGVFIFDINTEAKMERYCREPAAADLEQRDTVAIVDVERVKRYRYLVSLKVFKRRKGDVFTLHRLDIPEIVVPTDRIVKDLQEEFARVSLVDPERRRHSSATEELFFVCRSAVTKK